MRVRFLDCWLVEVEVVREDERLLVNTVSPVQSYRDIGVLAR